MRAKLSLKLEDLTVDSFSTTRPQKQNGTVFGEQCTCYTNCTCPGCPTCYDTCNYTCDDATCPACPTCAASCNGTCNAATCDNSCDGGCDYSLYCDTNQPCPTAQYSNCGNIMCY